MKTSFILSCLLSAMIVTLAGCSSPKPQTEKKPTRTRSQKALEATKEEQRLAVAKILEGAKQILDDEDLLIAFEGVQKEMNAIAEARRRLGSEPGFVGVVNPGRKVTGSIHRPYLRGQGTTFVMNFAGVWVQLYPDARTSIIENIFITTDRFPQDPPFTSRRKVTNYRRVVFREGVFFELP